MNAPEDVPRRRRRISDFCFHAAVLLLVSAFVVLEVRRAGLVTLWLDELAGLSNARDQTAADLLVRGAQPQGSPAPLTYLIDRLWARCADATPCRSLRPQARVRIPSILLTGGLGWAALAIAGTLFSGTDLPLRRCQQALGGAALATYLFNPVVHHYAFEARPYAAWNGLFLVALALALRPSPPRPALGATLTLLAFSSTGSCFQIAAFGTAALMSSALQGRPVKDAWREAAVLGIPAGIALYYSLPTKQWPYVGPEWGTWAQFLGFWVKTNGLTWAVVLGSCALVWQNPGLRPHARPLLVLLGLLLAAPGIYWITRRQGFLFAGRQYIFFTCAPPVALLLGALALPTWTRFGRSRSVRAAVLAGAFLISTAAVLFGPARTANPVNSRRLTFVGDPALEALMKSGMRPAAIVHPAVFDESLHLNLVLIADWLRRPPGRSGGSAPLLIVRDDGSELLLDALTDRPGPGNWTSIPLDP